MESLSEKNLRLAKEFYDYYVESDTRNDFKKKVLARHYEVQFAYDLISVYLKNYGTKEENRRYREKRELFASVNIQYKKVLEILRLDEGLQMDALDNLKYSSGIPDYFRVCCKKYPQYKDELMELLNRYLNYKKAKINERNSFQTEKRLLEIDSFYESVINSGMFIVSDYVRRYVTGQNYDEMMRKVNAYNSSLRSKGLLGSYMAKLEDNRIKCYYNNIDVINEIKDGLESKNIDVFDIYLKMNMGIDSFKALCKGFWDDSTICLLNALDANNVFRSSVDRDSILKNKYFVNGEQVSDSLKADILDFFAEHYIPYCYFYLVLSDKMDYYLEKFGILKNNSKGGK